MAWLADHHTRLSKVLLELVLALVLALVLLLEIRFSFGSSTSTSTSTKIRSIATCHHGGVQRVVSETIVPKKVGIALKILRTIHVCIHREPGRPRACQFLGRRYHGLTPRCQDQWLNPGKCRPEKSPNGCHSH